MKSMKVFVLLKGTMYDSDEKKPCKIERTWTWSQDLLAFSFASVTSYSAPGQVTTF